MPWSPPMPQGSQLIVITFNSKPSYFMEIASYTLVIILLFVALAIDKLPKQNSSGSARCASSESDLDHLDTPTTRVLRGRKKGFIGSPKRTNDDPISGEINGIALASDNPPVTAENSDRIAIRDDTPTTFSFVCHYRETVFHNELSSQGATISLECTGDRENSPAKQIAENQRNPSGSRAATAFTAVGSNATSTVAEYLVKAKCHEFIDESGPMSPPIDMVDFVIKRYRSLMQASRAGLKLLHDPETFLLMEGDL